MPGCAPSESGGVANKFDAPAVVARSVDGSVDIRGGEGAGASAIGASLPDGAVDADAAADASGVSQVAVSAPDRASVLASRTSSIAASDALNA